MKIKGMISFLSAWVGLSGAASAQLPSPGSSTLPTSSAKVIFPAPSQAAPLPQATTSAPTAAPFALTGSSDAPNHLPAGAPAVSGRPYHAVPSDVSPFFSGKSIVGPSASIIPWAVGQGIPADGDHSAGAAVIRRGVLPADPFADAHLLPQDGIFKVYGWLDSGYIGNFSRPASRFHGPYNAVDRDELMFNQAYLIVERALSKSEGVDIGGRIDLLYGFDFLLAQSRGFELTPSGAARWNNSQYYGLAIPQAYGEIGNQDLSVKVGHFYTIIGYEGVPSTANFFYSKSYSYQFAGPFTHWGVLGSARAGGFTIEAGIVNGWNALDRESDQPNFLGRIRWADEQNILGISFAIITGNEETLTNSPFNRNRTRYSFIVDLNPTDRLEYVFHHWFGLQDDGQFIPTLGVPPLATRAGIGGPASTGGTALWYGIDQYVYYRISDCLKAGVRMEWFRDEDGTRVGLNRPANPNKRPLAGNFWSTSVGLNYQPTRNVLIRPELRWDAQGSGFPAFDDGNRKNQLMAGLDVLIGF